MSPTFTPAAPTPDDITSARSSVDIELDDRSSEYRRLQLSELQVRDVSHHLAENVEEAYRQLCNPQRSSTKRSLAASCAFPQESQLLGLPPELRNRIYRYVVQKCEYIEVYSTGYRRPPLLSTCRQVRSEALAPFYAENKFICYMPRCDSTSCYRFITTLPRMRLRKCIAIIKHIGYADEPNRANLVVWVKRYWEGKALGLSEPEKQLEIKAGQVVMTLAGLFATVDHLLKMPWAQVEKIVVSWKSVFVALDGRWAVDYQEGLGRRLYL